uniref:Secreted protein n=1 Tax=Echinococcus granulosus TaxID=6210 RepID=U6FR46_ECHGR|nr:hypothetical protein EgrG_001154400 [Echinococcus granulosus]
MKRFFLQNSIALLCALHLHRILAHLALCHHQPLSLHTLSCTFSNYALPTLVLRRVATSTSSHPPAILITCLRVMQNFTPHTSFAVRNVFAPCARCTGISSPCIRVIFSSPAFTGHLTH